MGSFTVSLGGSSCGHKVTGNFSATWSDTSTASTASLAGRFHRSSGLVLSGVVDATSTSFAGATMKANLSGWLPPNPCLGTQSSSFTGTLSFYPPNPA